MIKKFPARPLKALATLVAVFVLSSCYLPVRYDAEIDLSDPLLLIPLLQTVLFYLILCHLSLKSLARAEKAQEKEVKPGGILDPAPAAEGASEQGVAALPESIVLINRLLA